MHARQYEAPIIGLIALFITLGCTTLGCTGRKAFRGDPLQVTKHVGPTSPDVQAPAQRLSTAQPRSADELDVEPTHQPTLTDQNATPSPSPATASVDEQIAAALQNSGPVADRAKSEVEAKELLSAFEQMPPAVREQAKRQGQ